MVLREALVDTLLAETLAVAFIQIVGAKEEVMAVVHIQPREEDHRTLEAVCLRLLNEELPVDMVLLLITPKVISMEALVLADPIPWLVTGTSSMVGSNRVVDQSRSWISGSQ